MIWWVNGKFVRALSTSPQTSINLLHSLHCNYTPYSNILTRRHSILIAIKMQAFKTDQPHSEIEISRLSKRWGKRAPSVWEAFVWPLPFSGLESCNNGSAHYERFKNETCCLWRFVKLSLKRRKDYWSFWKLCWWQHKCRQRRLPNRIASFFTEI